MTTLTDSNGVLADAPSPFEGQPARALFARRQQALLDYYGVDAVSRRLLLAPLALRLHVLEAGSGAPAIVLHGGDGQGVEWAPLLAELQGSLHLYAVDRPGFGLSDPFDYRHVDLRRHAADVVVSLLDALELERATLIGGSMGGFIALAAALAHPERVDSLVLVGMPAGVTRSAPLPLRLICGVPGGSRLFMRSLVRGGADKRKQQYRQMFGIDPATVPEPYFELQEAGLRIPGAAETWAVLLRRVASLRGLRRDVLLVDDLPRIRPRTLFLWGERDMAPAEAGRAASETMPDARFVVIPNVGHFPFLEVPGLCARMILDFLGDDTELADLEVAS
jgi:pimeloyl-ACP methyl ester carboxylesterase